MKKKSFGYGTYFLVYVALMLLLGATCWLAYVDLGHLNTPVSLLIAALKGALVMLVFMHLRLSDGLHRLFALSGLMWLAIMIGLTLSDVLSRHWLDLPGKWP